MDSRILIVFSLLLAFNVLISSANQPSYQVSIYAHLHPRNPPIHLCNGAIIQSRLILTTASCVHFQFSIINPAIRIVPTMLSIIAGSSTPFSDELVVQVSDILLAKNFNYTTGENDLALLRLSDKLPLNTRNDMKWIILDDAEIYDGTSCLANFYVRNKSQDGAENYIQSEELPLLDSEICSNRSEYPTEREDDICSLYYLPTGFNCNSFETLQHYNEDRGTGLVCANNLVGILSTILPLLSRTNCVDKPLKAYYTSLAPHLEWIYGVISQEEMKMFEQGNYMSSSPYAGETFAFVQTEMEITDNLKKSETTEATIDNSIKISSEPSIQKEQGVYAASSSNAEESYDVVQPIITEPGSTLAQIAGSVANPTEPSVKPNSAHKVISWQYLPGICGLSLLLRSFSLF